MAMVPYCQAQQSGIGVRYSIATGNQADLAVEHFAEFVSADPSVRVLLLYMETIKHPDILRRVAATARSRNLPVVVLKAGRSRQAQAIARSHTGALANDDRVVSAFLARLGFWRVADCEALMRCVTGCWRCLIDWTSRRVLTQPDLQASLVRPRLMAGPDPICQTTPRMRLTPT